MKTNGIGRLIGEARIKAGISQRKLCKGLCSVQLLSKIEKEERVPDIMLLEALLQRMGKSPEKLEIILTVDEYRRIEHRDEIEEAIRFGRLTEAEGKLQTYLEKYKREGTMQILYGLRMEGILALERGEYDKAENRFKAAVMHSVSEEKWIYLERELLCTFELENFVLLSQVWLKQGEMQSAEALLESLYRYAKTHITDEEETVKMQSKIAALLGEIYNATGRYQDCVRICEPVFELERELFMLQAMSLLMENLICAFCGMGEKEQADKIRIWQDTLEEVFVGQGLHIDCVNGMYFNCSTRQYYLDSELIRGERIRKGMTQEQLCEGVYECVESVSRVENGKESPNRIKFRQLMERLGVGKSRYNAYLATNEYEAMEIDAKIEKHLSRRCYEDAKRELEYLEHFIDMTAIENVQLVQRRRNIILQRENKMMPLQVMEEAEKLLSVTYGFEETNLVRVPFRNELYLYNQICLMLWKLGRKEECIAAYQRMVGCFEKSRVNAKYHFRSIALLISHMTDCMEKIGKLEVAEYWTIWGLNNVLKNGKGTTIERLLSDLVCIYQKQNINRELCLKIAWQTLRCSELFKQKCFGEVTKKYIQDNF